MPKVAGKEYSYTKEGMAKAKKKARSLLTAQQRTLPKALQERIIKSKMKRA